MFYYNIYGYMNMKKAILSVLFAVASLGMTRAQHLEYRNSKNPNQPLSVEASYILTTLKSNPDTRWLYNYYAGSGGKITLKPLKDGFAGLSSPKTREIFLNSNYAKEFLAGVAVQEMHEVWQNDMGWDVYDGQHSYFSKQIQNIFLEIDSHITHVDALIAWAVDDNEAPLEMTYKGLNTYAYKEIEQYASYYYDEANDTYFKPDNETINFARAEFAKNLLENDAWRSNYILLVMRQFTRKASFSTKIPTPDTELSFRDLIVIGKKIEGNYLELLFDDIATGKYNHILEIVEFEDMQAYKDFYQPKIKRYSSGLRLD